MLRAFEEGGGRPAMLSHAELSLLVVVGGAPASPWLAACCPPALRLGGGCGLFFHIPCLPQVWSGSCLSLGWLCYTYLSPDLVSAVPCWFGGQKLLINHGASLWSLTFGLQPLTGLDKAVKDTTQEAIENTDAKRDGHTELQVAEARPRAP